MGRVSLCCCFFFLLLLVDIYKNKMNKLRAQRSKCSSVSLRQQIRKKNRNDETFLLSRTYNRHSSVDNLHTHCKRCMLVDVGRAGRLIYFGYARCPVRMCWFDQFTVRFGFSVALGFTRIHLSAARFQLYLQRSFFSSLSFDLSISLSLCFSSYLFLGWH